MISKKELQGILHADDETDDDLDSFSDFTQRHLKSEEPVHSQELSASQDTSQQQSPPASQGTTVLSSSTPTIDIPVELKKHFISDANEFNQWFGKLLPAQRAKRKSSKLRNCVLLYWPAQPKLPKPGSSRFLQYKGAIEHGAILSKAWNDGSYITHIVLADPESEYRNYKILIDDLKLPDGLPLEVHLVNSAWAHESILQGKQDVFVARYRLKSHIEHLKVLTSKTAATAGPLMASLKRGRTLPDTQTVNAVSFKNRKIDPPPKLQMAATTSELDTLQKQDARREEERLAMLRHVRKKPEDPGMHALGKLPRGHAARHYNHKQTPEYLRRLDEYAAVAEDMPDREFERQLPFDFGSRMAEKIGLADVPSSERNHNSVNELVARGDYKAPSDITTQDANNIQEWQRLERERAVTPDVDDDKLEASLQPSALPKRSAWLCANSNVQEATESGPNAMLMEQLKSLADHYEKKKNSSDNDQFRARGYRQAISTIRKHKTAIRSKEDALKLRTIGESIATKIGEFCQGGRILLADKIQADPRENVLKLFIGIYGVGLRTAENWWNQGLRTLQDLKSIKLHDYQHIGYDHYEDFNSRIPRAEVTAHVEYVIAAAHKISEHLQIVVGGSYRRGQADSGDIDFLITASDTEINTLQLKKLVFEELIPGLREAGYIKADLTIPSEDKEHSKWLGAACLPSDGGEIWRRVDFLMVPAAEWGAALIYFTGNDIFNRSLRLKARKACGTLNQRGLYKNVVRDKNGVKLNPGVLVEGRDERRIFQKLGVEWRPPHERCP